MKNLSSLLETAEDTSNAPAKAGFSAAADTEAWLHRLDEEFTERKASAVQLPSAKVAGRYRTRAFVVSGASPRKTDSFALVKPTGVSTCKDLLRTSVRKHKQAISMTLKMEQPAEDILLQAAKTIGP